MEIVPVFALADNYIWLLRDPTSGFTAAIDPGVAGPVLAALDRFGWSLAMVLGTHHHDDHVGANKELKEATGCEIVGPLAERDRIPGIERGVGEGDHVNVGGHQALVLDTPGHTDGHITYWFEGQAALFSGDTLYPLGCGRVLEGTPERMWASLLRLRGLPGQTRLFPAHEFTANFAAFALQTAPGDEALRAYPQTWLANLRKGPEGALSTIADERAANPFLRCDEEGFLAAAGLAGLKPAAAFAQIRGRKNDC